MALVICSSDQAGNPSILSSAERAQYAAFVNEAARQRFLTGRWLVRHVLASGLGCSPESVPLTLAEGGKPICPLPEAPQFNLSHAGRHVAAVFSTAGAVGVDIEDTGRNVNAAGIADRFFAPAEVKILADQGPRGFFAIWTRKEAMLKAMGTGLTGAWSTLDTFASDWQFHTYGVGESMLASVACHHSVPTLRNYRLTDDEQLVTFAPLFFSTT